MGELQVSDIKNVTGLGAGLMGAQIGELMAESGNAGLLSWISRMNS